MQNEIESKVFFNELKMLFHSKFNFISFAYWVELLPTREGISLMKMNFVNEN